MLIGIDASRAFVSQRTGTENYSYQLIKAIAKIDKKNSYILYTRFFNNRHCEESHEVGRRGNLTSNSRLPRSLCSLAMTGNLSSNFTIKNIPLPRLWTQVGLAKEIFFNSPDVLFIPAHTLPLIRHPGLKTVVTIHDLGYEYLPQYHQFPQKLYLNKSTEFAVKQATHLIAVSKATKKDLINKLNCPEEKITVVYEGFDKKKFSPNYPKIPNIPKTPYILFVGTLQPRKNIERLIEAFAKITDNKSNLQLVIAGNKGWLYDEILAAPKKFGIGKRVKFLGYTTDDDLAKLYSGALCFCLPSLFEGFGLPVLEAMACGCPVILSNNSSLPEVAGDAGLYVDPYNVDDIASKLKLIMENGKLRREMREKSLKQAQKFSWEKAARETIEVFNSLTR